MELRNRALRFYAIVLVLVLSGLSGCKNAAPPPSEPVAVTPQPVPTPTQPVPCTIRGKFQIRCFTIPADTPVVASGSSIDIDSKAPVQGSNRTFTATSSNIGWLSFDGFDQFPQSQQFSGWVLHISNRNKTNAEKQDAMTICSDSSCTGKSLDSNGKIYIMVRSGSWMTTPDSSHLTFHDSECDGSSSASSPGVNRQCDFFMKLKVKSADLTGDLVGKCTLGGTDGVCAVGIGKP
jgi:hypothetical protein